MGGRLKDNPLPFISTEASYLQLERWLDPWRREPSKSCLINLELHLILAGAAAEVLPDSLEAELFVRGESGGNISEIYLS